MVKSKLEEYYQDQYDYIHNIRKAVKEVEWTGAIGAPAQNFQEDIQQSLSMIIGLHLEKIRCLQRNTYLRKTRDATVEGD